MIKWWLGSVKSQVFGTVLIVLVVTWLTYLGMKSGLVPVFDFPQEINIISLLALLASAAFFFKTDEQKRMLRYFSKMPWMNVLYAQLATFFLLSLSSYVLTRAVAQGASFGTSIRAYATSIGIIVLTVFCLEAIAIIRQLRIGSR